MRVKTSITLSRDTLAAIDRVAGRRSNRSQVIEEAVRAWLAQRARSAREARERDLLDQVADALNDELADALAYQTRL